MKRLLIASYIILGLLAAGAEAQERGDFTAITPSGTAYGYVSPNRDFLIMGPSRSAINPSPMEPSRPAQPSPNYYGYNVGGGDSIVINPGGGTTYIYGDRR